MREHGRGGEDAEGDGDQIHKSGCGRRRDSGGPALLPRPRRLHDRDLQLRQPPRRASRRGDGPHLLPRQPPNAGGPSTAAAATATTATACGPSMHWNCQALVSKNKRHLLSMLLLVEHLRGRQILCVCVCGTHEYGSLVFLLSGGVRLELYPISIFLLLLSMFDLFRVVFVSCVRNVNIL